MEWRLVEIKNQRVISENAEQEKAQPEQIDPEDFEALFEHMSWDLILSVRFAQGYAILPHPAC